MGLLKIIQANPSLQPETLFQISGWPITNSMLMTWLVVLIFIFLAIYIKKTNSLKVQKSGQNFFEMLVEMLLGLLDQITGKREKSEKLLPLIGSIFLFLTVGNLITLLPIFTSITYKEASLLRTPTNDYNTTLGMALMVVILTQLVSMRVNGVFGHIGKYIQIKGVIEGFKKGFGAGIMSIIYFVTGLLDIIGDLAKIISLSLRLLGNMFAGEVLMAVMMAGLAFIAPSILYAQSLLVGLIQALVFAVLSSVYLSMADDANQEETAEANP